MSLSYNKESTNIKKKERGAQTKHKNTLTTTVNNLLRVLIYL
jgi:hypothetical protein